MKIFYKRTNTRLAQPINSVILWDYSSHLGFLRSSVAAFSTCFFGDLRVNTYRGINKRAFSSLTSLTARGVGGGNFINSDKKVNERVFSV